MSKIKNYIMEQEEKQQAVPGAWVNWPDIKLPPINLPVMSTRSSVLQEADKIVSGARADAYGGPEDSFKTIAKLWQAYLDGRNTINATDVASMMTLLKIARLKTSPDHRDSWVDIAGYAACGAECGLK